MQLTNDAGQAEVVIIYLLNLRRALLVDKRRVGEVGPFVADFPQQELLLEGKALQAPLTPRFVHLIERRQVMPADQQLMQSYFRQLLEAIAFRLLVLRPRLPPVERLSIGPHFAPAIALAVSDLWRGLLGELEHRREHEAVHHAREAMRELCAYEVLHAERRDQDEVELLRQDAHRQEIYRVVRL